MFSKATAAPQNDLLLEGQRALLRAVHDPQFTLESYPTEVLHWLEDNGYIEELLDDDNEFQLAVTPAGYAALGQHSASLPVINTL